MANVLQTIKNKIIDSTADVLSLPAKIKQNRVARQASVDTAALQADRKTGGNAITPDANSPAFQNRVLADDARFRRSKQNY